MSSSSSGCFWRHRFPKRSHNKVCHLPLRYVFWRNRFPKRSLDWIVCEFEHSILPNFYLVMLSGAPTYRYSYQILRYEIDSKPLHMEHLTCTNRIRMPWLITCFDHWPENLYTNPLSLLPTWLLQESRGIVFGVAAWDLAQINDLLVSTFWVPSSNIKIPHMTCLPAS